MENLNFVEKLEATGERFLPDQMGGNIELEHKHRYLMAKEYCYSKKVLDIASGEGYGSALLAEISSEVLGVDLDPQAVSYANMKYKNSNLKFINGSCSKIPLEDNSIDVVVSFETIEHHDQHEEMMAEIKRVLQPSGCLIISSPDKENYSIKPNYKNPFHVKELYKNEFEDLLGKYFKNYKIFGQRIQYGSCILLESGEGNCGSYFEENKKITKGQGITSPLYLIAVASDEVINSYSSSILEVPVWESEELSQTKKELTQTKQALNERIIQIQSIFSSRSWKITMPLRKIIKTIRVVKKYFFLNKKKKPFGI